MTTYPAPFVAPLVATVLMGKLTVIVRACPVVTVVLVTVLLFPAVTLTGAAC